MSRVLSGGTRQLRSVPADWRWRMLWTKMFLAGRRTRMQALVPLCGRRLGREQGRKFVPQRLRLFPSRLAHARALGEVLGDRRRCPIGDKPIVTPSAVNTILSNCSPRTTTCTHREHHCAEQEREHDRDGDNAARQPVPAFGSSRGARSSSGAARERATRSTRSRSEPCRSRAGERHLRQEGPRLACGAPATGRRARDARQLPTRGRLSHGRDRAHRR
jgi:hypothetical protein